MSSDPAPAESGDVAQAKTIVEDGYNIIAPAYLAWASPRPTVARLAYLDKVVKLLKPGDKLLELGCGAGVPCTRTFLDHGIDVTGADISSTQIALAREHVPQATLIHGDMMSLSFEPESFDAVVGFYSVFHLPKEEQGVMVRKIVGWLKDGGWLLFNLATQDGDLMFEDWLGAKMFWSGLGVDGNREMMRNEGRGLRIVEDDVVVEMVGSMEERFHWFLATKEGVERTIS